MTDTSKNDAELIRQRMENIRAEIVRLQQQLRGMQDALDIVEGKPQPREAAIPEFY